MKVEMKDNLMVVMMDLMLVGLLVHSVVEPLVGLKDCMWVEWMETMLVDLMVVTTAWMKETSMVAMRAEKMVDH